MIIGMSDVSGAQLVTIVDCATCHQFITIALAFLSLENDDVANVLFFSF